MGEMAPSPSAYESEDPEDAGHGTIHEQHYDGEVYLLEEVSSHGQYRYHGLTDQELAGGAMQEDVGEYLRVIGVPAHLVQHFFLTRPQLMHEELYETDIAPLLDASRRLIVVLDERDARDPFVYTQKEWQAFVDGSKAGEFDHLIDRVQPRPQDDPDDVSD